MQNAPERFVHRVTMYRDGERRNVVDRETVIGTAPEGFSRFQGVAAMPGAMVEFDIDAGTLEEAFNKFDESLAEHINRKRIEQAAKVVGLSRVVRAN